MVNCRLKWHLKSKQILAPEQARFSKSYSIGDQVSYLFQTIKDAFQEKKQVIALWVDFKHSFDKEWKEGLAVKCK